MVVPPSSPRPPAAVAPGAPPSPSSPSSAAPSAPEPAPPRLEPLRYALFAARCAGAAALSQAVAQAMGLHYPVWAALSALVVSQERLAETRSSVSGRILGTVVGMVVAVLVHLAAVALALGEQVQVSVAVAIGALLARRFPRARTCMWTAAIVLIAPAEGDQMPIPEVALFRGTEVTLGGLIGAAAHFCAEKVFLWCQRIVMRRRKAST